MASAPLSPFGAAKQRFLRARRDPQGDGAVPSDRVHEVKKSSGHPGDDLAFFFAALRSGVARQDLSVEQLFLCQQLVELQWSLGVKQKRALTFLVLASSVAAQQGSTRIRLSTEPDEFLCKTIAELVAASGLKHSAIGIAKEIRELAYERTFDSLIGTPGEFKPFILYEHHLYRERVFRRETSLVGALSQRISLDAARTESPLHPSQKAVTMALATLQQYPSLHRGAQVELSAEQTKAVVHALTRRFTLVTGGPGTGKTTIIASMVRAAVRLGADPRRIVLAAPTGKAAQRMTRSLHTTLSNVSPLPQEDEPLIQSPIVGATLHRILGYQPKTRRFRFHENNRIKADLIIVDETSMVDLELMERLLSALPSHARLVLVGDENQIPSIDAGDVFRGLMNVERRLPSLGLAISLTQSHRMKAETSNGAKLLRAAKAITSGDSALALKSLEPTRALKQVGGAWWLQGSGNARSVLGLVNQWHQAHVADNPAFDRLSNREYELGPHGFSPNDSTQLESLFDLVNRSKFLTATRQMATGCNAINTQLHRLRAAYASTDKQPLFLPGEPVIVCHNLHRLGLSNGDLGVIVRVRDSRDGAHKMRYSGGWRDESGGAARHEFRACFPLGSEWVCYGLDTVRSHIEHAWALTIHKCQGSEFDEVIIVLPEKSLPMLSRELLYTAVTRAAETAIFVGSTRILKAAIEQTSPRSSGIDQRLAESLAPQF